VSARESASSTAIAAATSHAGPGRSGRRCTAKTAAQTTAAITGRLGPRGIRPGRMPRATGTLRRNQQTVLELEHGVHPRREIRVVGDDDETRAERRVQLEHQIEHALPG